MITSGIFFKNFILKRKSLEIRKNIEKFIKLARNVYQFNDERAKIKLQINLILNSNIKEVKSHF